MKTTNQIFHQYNNALKKRLLQEPTKPIYCNSVTDPNDIAFEYPSDLSLPIKKLIKT